jgi:hypothetical protein
VNDSATEDDWFAGVSGAVVRYPAMLAATVAGQLAGIAVDAVVGSRAVWLPLAFSVVLEAFAGARAGGARAGVPLDSGQSARVSLRYSLGLVALSAPLVVWIAASHPIAPDGSVGLSVWTPARLIVATAALAVATLVRWRLMVVFAPRRR